MSSFLIVSIAIRLAAIAFGMAWSLVLLRRLRDWRIALFTLALGLMAAREGLTLLGREDYGVLSLISGAGYTPGILLSVVEAVAVIFLVQFVIERRRSEDALRESERRFRVLFENSAEAITLHDASGTVIYVSPNNERLWGFSGDEVVGRNSFEFIHPDDSELVKGLLARILQHPEESLTAEFRLLAKDGTCQHTEAVGRNLLADPSVRAIVVNFRNITERKLAADALMESEDRYRDLIEHSQDLICTHDLDGRILSINPWAAKVLGYEPDAALKMSIRDVLAPEVRHEFDEYVAKIRRDGAAQGLMLTQTRFGEKRLWEYSNTLRTEGVPAPVVRGMAHDITERKRTERALSESERRFRTLAALSPVGIFESDATGRCLYVNQRGADLVGLSESECLGFGWTRALFAEDRHRVQKRWQQTVRTKEPFQEEYRFRQQDGSVVWIIGHIVAGTNSEGRHTGFIGTLTDITERKQAEESLRQLSGRLLHLQDEERRHIARELHDTIAQNLAALAMNLSVLEASASALDGKARKALTESLELTDSSSREIRTLSYLLHPPLLDEMGLTSAVRWYADGFSERSGIQVDLDTSVELGRLPSEVETALFRIVQECLTNVHRHSGSTKVRIALARDSAEVALEVEDEGRGMQPGMLESSGPNVVRLGVGIAGMRERVRELGGSLEIKSGERGTTVRAILPLDGGYR